MYFRDILEVTCTLNIIEIIIHMSIRGECPTFNMPEVLNDAKKLDL
jgi:hypothetical protein